MSAQPQAIIFLDDTGNLRCETPSANGARRKLNLGAEVSANLSIDKLAEQIRANAYAIADELIAQHAKAEEQAQARKAREKTLERKRHETILLYTAANHPWKLARIDPDWRAALQRVQKRTDPKRAKELKDAELTQILLRR